MSFSLLCSEPAASNSSLAVRSCTINGSIFRRSMIMTPRLASVWDLLNFKYSATEELSWKDKNGSATVTVSFS